MEKREIIRDLLLIVCVFVLFVIPWTYVFGVEDEALAEAIRVVQRYVGIFIVFFLILRLIYNIYGKSLPQEMQEEEIKEVNQKDKKQLIFKPTIGVVIFFLFMILLGIGGFIDLVLLRPNEDPLGYFVMDSILVGVALWLWYITPVFIFSDDSVEIKSFLFSVFGIDRTIIIRYTDITSVEPNAKMSYEFRRYRIGISVRGTFKNYSLAFFNSDVIAKIYLRFKEKLGDKVRLE